MALAESPSTPAYERSPCLACGSMERAHSVTFTDTFEMRGQLAWKARHPHQRKPFAWGKTGDSYWRDGARWVQRLIGFDRDYDRYQERVWDPSSEEVIHEVDEPLRAHRGHGSAKQSPPKRRL